MQNTTAALAAAAGEIAAAGPDNPARIERVVAKLLDRAAFAVKQMRNESDVAFAREYRGKAEGIVTTLAALTGLDEDGLHEAVRVRSEEL